MYNTVLKWIPRRIIIQRSADTKTGSMLENVYDSNEKENKVNKIIKILQNGIPMFN